MEEGVFSILDIKQCVYAINKIMNPALSRPRAASLCLLLNFCLYYQNLPCLFSLSCRIFFHLPASLTPHFLSQSYLLCLLSSLLPLSHTQLTAFFPTLWSSRNAKRRAKAKSAEIRGAQSETQKRKVKQDCPHTLSSPSTDSVNFFNVKFQRFSRAH